MSSTWWIFLCLCPYHLLQANPQISPPTSPPLSTATAAATRWIVPARRTQKPPKQWNRSFQKAGKIHVTQLDLRLTSRWSLSRKAELSPGQAFHHRRTASYKVFKNTATAWNCCVPQRRCEEVWYLTGTKKMQLQVTAITFKCASLKRIPVQSTGKLDFSFKSSVITETRQRLSVSCLSYNVFLQAAEKLQEKVTASTHLTPASVEPNLYRKCIWNTLGEYGITCRIQRNIPQAQQSELIPSLF